MQAVSFRECILMESHIIAFSLLLSVPTSHEAMARRMNRVPRRRGTQGSCVPHRIGWRICGNHAQLWEVSFELCTIELGCYQVPILNLPSIELCFDRFWGPFTLTMPSRDALLHWNMLCNFCGFPWYKSSSIWSTASWFKMMLSTRNSWSTQDMIEKNLRII